MIAVVDTVIPDRFPFKDEGCFFLHLSNVFITGDSQLSLKLP